MTLVYGLQSSSATLLYTVFCDCSVHYVYIHCERLCVYAVDNSDLHCEQAVDNLWITLNPIVDTVWISSRTVNNLCITLLVVDKSAFNCSTSVGSNLLKVNDFGKP